MCTGLPTPDRAIDIEWVDLNQPRPALRSFGRDQGRAGAAEYIEHHPSTPGAIPHRIGISVLRRPFASVTIRSGMQRKPEL